MKRILIAAVAVCTLALGGCSQVDSETADDATTPVITSIEEEPASPEEHSAATTTVSEVEESDSAAAPVEASYQDRAPEEFAVSESGYVVETGDFRCWVTRNIRYDHTYFECQGEISEPAAVLDNIVNEFYPANALLYREDRGFREERAGSSLEPSPTTLEPGQRVEIHGFTFASPAAGELVIDKDGHSVTYSSGAYLPAGSTHPQVLADGTAEMGAICGQVTMNPAVGPVDVVSAFPKTNCHEGLAAFQEYAENLEVAGQNGVHMLYEAGPWTCSSGQSINAPDTPEYRRTACTNGDQAVMLN